MKNNEEKRQIIQNKSRMDRIITFFKIVRQQAWQAKRNKGGRASLWKVWKCLEMLAVVWNLRTFQPEIIQCTYTMQLCCNRDAHNAAPCFSGGKKKKKNKNRKEKIPKEAFTSRPMSRRNRLEDFSFRFRGMCRFNDLWNLKKSQRSSGYYLRDVN